MKLRSLESFRLPWQSYGSEILFCDFENGVVAQGFEVPCSQTSSRALVLQQGGELHQKASTRNVSVIWPPLMRGASTKLFLFDEMSFSDNPYV